MNGRYLGAILAGGRSRRFGAPKALAEVGGRSIVSRVRDALAEAVSTTVLVVDKPELYSGMGLDVVLDAHPGQGPLAGIHVALLQAEQRGMAGALCVACDMPFLSPALLAEMPARADATGADAVAPEGPGGVAEPLCALYSVRCLPEVMNRLVRGERSARALLAAVHTHLIPSTEVGRWGDLGTMFTNVNTPEEHRRAEEIIVHRSSLHAG